MSNDMKEINREIFDRLGARAEGLVNQELLAVPRAIATDAVGKDWLKNGKVKKAPYLALGPKAEFAIAHLRDRSFLVSVGVTVSPPAEADLIPVELNSGAFTLIVCALKVPIVQTADLGYDLLENVFLPLDNKGDKAVILAMGAVEKYFTKVSLFEIRPGSSLSLQKENGYRASLAAVLSASSARPLEWTNSTLERLGAMAVDRTENIPFHLLFRMLTESRGDAAFLDVYRCVEQLFPLPRIAVLCAELGVSVPAMSVARSLETHLGWRRPEIDSLIQIMNGGPPALLERLRVILSVASELPDIPAAVARAVYDLRNRCVHFRAVHASDFDSPQPDWLQLSDALLEFVQLLYAENAHAFGVPTSGKFVTEVAA